jgi:CBS domain-containing protein
MRQGNEDPRDRAATMGLDAGSIEKGWLVYDSLERPLGNVTDVEGGVLHMDGRPEGLGMLEVPLQHVKSAGDGDVHLNVTMEEVTGRGTPPVTEKDQTRLTGTTSSTSERQETHPGVSYTAAGAPIGQGSSASGGDRPRTFGSEPHVVPRWEDTTNDEGGRGLMKWLAMAGFGVSVLVGFLWWRRRRARRGPVGRVMHALSGAGESIAPLWETAGESVAPAWDAARESIAPAWEAARERNPAWWLAPLAALPLLYYFKSSEDKGAVQQAADRWMRDGSWSDRLAQVEGLKQRLPSTDELTRRMTSANVRGYVPNVRGYLPDEPPSMWTVGIPLAAAGAALWFLFGRGGTSSHRRQHIRDVMTSSPQVIRPEATVAEAASLMRRLDVGAIPVCDGRRLQGMITDRDIVVRSVSDGRDPHLTTVRDVMTDEIVYAFEDDPVDRAASLMRDRQIRRLPIVDRDKDLVGIVSLGDLAVDTGDDRLSGETLERVSSPSRPSR